MRFHVGFSFRLKHLKKLLIPILIGLATYFGIGFFGILKVNALVNLDSSYNLSYSELEVLDTKIDDNLTYNEFFNYINNIESSYYKVLILVNFVEISNVKYVDYIRLFLLPYNTASFSSSIFGRSSTIYFNSTIPTSLYYDILSYNTSYSNILENSNYLNFYNCFTTNSCSNQVGSTSFISTIYAKCSSSVNNSSSFNCSIPFYYTYSTNYSGYIIYSSKVPIYYTETISDSDSNTFYKSLYINDTKISDGDYFISYKEYLDSLYPPDEPPDEPSDDDTEHKGLFSKIYWFDDNSTSYGVLISIYELLFLYCLSMILFKILTFLKNKRW